MDLNDHSHAMTPPPEEPDSPPVSSLSISESYDETWRLFRRFFWWILVVQAAMYLLSEIASSFIVKVKTPGLLIATQLCFALLVTLPIGFGYSRFMIRFARGEKPHKDDWYIGYRRYGRLIGMILGYTLLFGGAALPLIIVFMAAGSSSTEPNVAVGLFALLYMLGLALLAIYVLFVMNVLADIPESGVMQSFQIGVDLVKGNWGKILGLLLSMFPLGLVGGLVYSLPRIVQTFNPDAGAPWLVPLWLIAACGALMFGFTSLLINRAYIKLRAINGYPEPPTEGRAVDPDPGTEQLA